MPLSSSASRRSTAFPTQPIDEGEELTAHALYYAPTNAKHTVPEGVTNVISMACASA